METIVFQLLTWNRFLFPLRSGVKYVNNYLISIQYELLLSFQFIIMNPLLIISGKFGISINTSRFFQQVNANSVNAILFAETLKHIQLDNI